MLSGIREKQEAAPLADFHFVAIGACLQNLSVTITGELEDQ
jgi:hypothetical protein